MLLHWHASLVILHSFKFRCSMCWPILYYFMFRFFMLYAAPCFVAPCLTGPYFTAACFAASCSMLMLPYALLLLCFAGQYFTAPFSPLNVTLVHFSVHHASLANTSLICAWLFHASLLQFHYPILHWSSFRCFISLL